MSTIGRPTSRMLNNKRFGSTFELVRRSAGSYVDGIYQEGAEETIVVKGNHQPASDDIRNNFDFGERVEEVKQIFIKTTDKNLVRPVREGVINSRGDIIRINNLNYEAYQVNNHSLNRHLEIIAVRRSDQSD